MQAKLSIVFDIAIEPPVSVQQPILNFDQKHVYKSIFRTIADLQITLPTHDT